MKKTLVAFGLAIVLMLSWVVPASACGSWCGDQVCATNNLYYHIGEGTVIAQLTTGTKVVGTLTIWETSVSGNFTNVKFDTVSGNFTKTALYIGRGFTCDSAENQIPQDKYGDYNPSSNLFNTHTFSSPSTSYTYSINESTLGIGVNKGKGSWLCIAAYAEILSTDKKTTYKAWGNIKPVAEWNLPRQPISEQVFIKPGVNNTYADLKLSNVPSGFSVGNGIYSSWCVSANVSIDYVPPDSTLPPVVYSAMLFSSLNLRGVPQYLTQNIQWDRINYILNHITPVTDWKSVQLAIWYFAGPGIQTKHFTSYPTPPNALYGSNGPASPAIINDALSNGKGFVPGPGQVGAVIVDALSVIGNPLSVTPDCKCPSYPCKELYQPMIIELYVPATCYQESSCHFECDNNWSPCDGNWVHQNPGCSDDNNPRCDFEHCGYSDNCQNFMSTFTNYHCGH